MLDGDVHRHPHPHGANVPHIPGVTEDPILRPVGILLALFGATWALFAPIAVKAGTMDLPNGALALIGGGLLMAVIGKRERQV
jgi:hypothetical protein